MTGYGSAQAAVEGWLISVEIRAVNSRFLDLSFKIPDDYRQLESLLRERIQNQVARGKVECRVQLKAATTSPSNPAINPAAVHEFAQHYAKLKDVLPDLRPPGLHELLSWPGVNASAPTDQLAVRDLILSLSAEALAQMRLARQREGAAISLILADRVRLMIEIAAPLRQQLPQVLSEQQARITERLETALGLVEGRNQALISIEEVRARISQEVALIASRIDVAEELDRLIVHCKEVLNLLASNKPVGKRLDFVVQELNREANTLGAKMVSDDFSKAAIDLKVLIEQLREQVQNLE